jgi:hypothetical protein
MLELHVRLTQAKEQGVTSAGIMELIETFPNLAALIVRTYSQDLNKTETRTETVLCTQVEELLPPPTCEHPGFI